MSEVVQLLFESKDEFFENIFPVRCVSLPNLEDNQGTIVNEANNDSNVAITTVTQN